eukprot:4850578-Prymnesium_polylepis.1
MKLVKRRSDGVMEMGGLHVADSSQRSQLQLSPKSWDTMAPRPSLDIALTLAENGVRCVPPISSRLLGVSETSNASQVCSGRVSRWWLLE